ncbi:hypothetical protein LTR08_006354 [Meristemomyces frigidus]|nr:hypothetical protein LTR08_006354 [Meristemomyces frigidus]
MAAVAAPLIDLTTTPATYPIRLGASILKPASSSHHTSIRYNHKPPLRCASSINATVKAASNGETRLRFKDGGSSYSYQGESANEAEAGQYVLVLKGEGKERQAVLEKLDEAHAFNLVSAPTGNALELAKLHPHIRPANANEPTESALVGDDDGSQGEADATNPFDYRHFLKAALAETAKSRKPAAAASTQSRVRSTAPVYVTPAKRNSLSAQQRQPADKRKLPAEKPAANTGKRVKSGPSPAAAKAAADAPASSKAKATAPNLPKIHLDRKASLRKSSYPSADSYDDDSGELVLENETPTTTTSGKQQSAMALALSGQFLGTGGPISLHSAASSPAGSRHNASPYGHSHAVDVGGESDDGEAEGDEELEGGGGNSNSFEFELGGDDAEDEDAEREGDEEDEGDDDADVEDLELPSPVRGARASVGAATVGVVEEDDLDAQLAAAMAEQEDEESEEE